MVVRGEEEAAGLAILEVREHRLGELDGHSRATARASGPAAARAVPRRGTRSRRDRPGNASGRPCARRAGGRRASSARAGSRRRAPRHRRRSGAVERARGGGQARDGEAVPAGEDLLVASRPDAPVAHREQLGARGVERRLRVLHGSGPACSGHLVASGSNACRCQAPSKFASRSSPKRRDEHGVLARVEQAAHFVARPDVELAFVALGVRVERRVEAAAAGSPCRAGSSRRSRRDAPEQRIAGGERRPVRIRRAAGRCRTASSRSAGSSSTGRPSSGRSRRPAGRRGRPRPCASA